MGPKTLGSRQHNHILVKLAAIENLILAHVGSSWRSWSPCWPSWAPSCLSCSPSYRQHVRKCSEIVQDSPQDASDTSSKPPKIAKQIRKPLVFQCFSLARPSPKNIKKCYQNCPRSSQVELKMSILALSCPILALSWPLLAPSWPI